MKIERVNGFDNLIWDDPEDLPTSSASCGLIIEDRPVTFWFALHPGGIMAGFTRYVRFNDTGERWVETSVPDKTWERVNNVEL